MGRFPGNLDDAVTAWLAGRSAGLAMRTADMTSAYRKGQTSGGIDLAAYLTARLPATFAVNARVMADIAALCPAFAPTSLADAGAGPGTAGWAALAAWPSISAVEQVEGTAAMAALLRQLNAGSGLEALVQAQVREQPLAGWQGEVLDLVLASYVLAEMPAAALADAIRTLWAAAGQVLVLIEPGTPDGFARILAARKQLLGQGAHLVGPCTHAQACPMAGGDWCHFKERVQRSRAHMYAKGATVPYEDEPYSWLAVSRAPLNALGCSPNTLGERVLAPPAVSKVGVDLKLCGAAGLTTVTIPARNKPAYKRAKKLTWGALWGSAVGGAVDG